MWLQLWLPGPRRKSQGRTFELKLQHRPRSRTVKSWAARVSLDQPVLTIAIRSPTKALSSWAGGAKRWSIISSKTATMMDTPACEHPQAKKTWVREVPLGTAPWWAARTQSLVKSSKSVRKRSSCQADSARVHRRLLSPVSRRRRSMRSLSRSRSIGRSSWATIVCSLGSPKSDRHQWLPPASKLTPLDSSTSKNLTCLLSFQPNVRLVNFHQILNLILCCVRHPCRRSKYPTISSRAIGLTDKAFTIKNRYILNSHTKNQAKI